MRSSSSSSPARVSGIEIRVFSPTRPSPSIDMYLGGMDDMLVFADEVDEGGPVGGGVEDELGAGGTLRRRAGTAAESPMDVVVVIAAAAAAADGLSGLLS